MATASEVRGGAPGGLVSLSGLAFVVVTVVAIVGISGDTPDESSSAAKVASFYAAHDSRQILSAFVLAAAVPLLVIFAVNLALSLWPSDAGRRPVWHVVLAGGSVLAGGAFALTAFLHFVVADSADHISASTLQGLNVLDASVWVAFNCGLGVMMLGAAGAMIPRTESSRFLAWAALVLGLALFIPFADFFALILTGVWIIVVSVMQYRAR